MKLDGKLALVSGGGRGLGRAVAQELGLAGCRVLVLDRPGPTLDQTVSALKERGISAFAIPFDLRDTNGIAALFRQIRQEHGPVQILVNNAALSTIGPFVSLGTENIRATVEVNLMAVMEMTRCALVDMIGAEESYVVNMGSQSTEAPLAFLTSYIATKTAVAAFSECLRRELHGTNVRVLHVMVGPTKSEGYELSDFSLMPGGGESVNPATPAWVARQVCRAVLAGRRKLYAPRQIFLRILLAVFHPLISWFMVRNQHQRVKRYRRSLVDTGQPEIADEQ